MEEKFCSSHVAVFYIGMAINIAGVRWLKLIGERNI